MIDYLEKQSDEDIERIAELAGVIWREYYRDLIGMDQIEYMLRKFQSAEVIRKQVREEGYRYFVAEENGPYLGYVALKEMPETNRLFLSKFYVLRSRRGRGIGKAMLRAAVSRFETAPETILRLTVNKENKGSLAAYDRIGFRIVEEVVADIGSGYVMDDYILECPVRTVLDG